MRTSYTIFAASVLLSGCASTIEFSSVEALNEDCRDVSGTLLLESGEKCQARVVRVDADSATVLDQSTDSRRRLSRAEILGFQHRAHVRGALDGLVMGGLMGLPTGLAIYSTRQPYGGIAAVGIIVLPVTVGILVGFFEGHEYTYRLHAAEPQIPDTLSGNRTDHQRPRGGHPAP